MTEARPRREPIVQLGTMLVPILTGLVASSILLVEYVRGVGVYCGDTGGCGKVRASAFSSLFGLIPTPSLGVLAFLFLGALALTRGIWARGVQLAVAGTGAALALVLLYVQAFVIGAWCKFCLVADVSMIVVAVLAALRVFKLRWDVARLPLQIGGGVVLALAAGVPIAYGMAIKDPMPPQIARIFADTPPGKVTVVDFVDFECPFCRIMNEDLEPLLEQRKAKLRIVRKQVPLTRIHPHALDAARAACCGEQMGKGDEMAHALFTAPVEELTPEGCEKIAQSLGLAQDAFHDCVASPKTEEKIRSDTALFRESGGHGLPTIWIGDTKLEGAGQPKETLERTLDEALAKAGS